MNTFTNSKYSRMMKKTWTIAASFFVTMAHSQPVKDSLLIEGHYRTFQYNLPSTDLSQGSLMFIMHGSGGSSNDMLKHSTQLEQRSSAEKLLLVYPDAYLHYWNECRKYSTAVANKININEAAFFNAMIDYFVNKFHISSEHVFAAGFSGGGHMAYKLGLTMPGIIKGIAAIVANLPDTASCDCIKANKALPVLIINGTDDPVNPFKGGEMFVNNASFGVVLASQNSFRYWASLAGYRGEPETALLPDTDTSDHKTIERYSFNQPGKPPVCLLQVNGGHHDYPGDIDVYVYAWNFFKAAE